MGSKLNGIINNKKMLIEKGKNGEALYLSEFSWASLEKKFEALYKKAVSIA
jgi:hypothetical protein